MNKKIHIITPIRYPVGGIRTYLKYTYGKLDRKKYSFTVIGPSSNWLERIREDLSGFDLDIVCSAREENTISLFSSIANALCKSKPDIIHSQGYTAGMLSSIANVIIGLPHIITLHRIFGYDQFSNVFWGRNATLKKYMIEFFLKRANVIQSVSIDAQSNLLEYFPGLMKTPGKLKMIRNGIIIDQFDDRLQGDNYPFIKEPGYFYIGYFGRYMPEKGFPHLIDMMEILVHDRNCENIRILCVGGFGELIREYQKEIKRRRLEKYFQFLDFFNNISPVLRNIELLIIPSLSEACGLISMEGLVCGTPVVAYSCLGLREVLAGTPARMVTVGDRAGLADQVVAIMEQYTKVKKTFMEFIPVARQRYDSSETARQLDAVFEALAGLRRS